MATTDYSSVDRGLPSSMDAERSVLGAILHDNLAYFQASELLRADDLSIDSHRRIYARIIEMMEANRSVDIITLSEELRTQQQLEAVGGVAYLASLTEGVPSRPNVEHYVKIIKDKALLRGLIGLSQLSISRALEQSEGVENILGEAEQGLMRLSEDSVQTGFLDVKQIVQEKFGSIDALVNQGNGVAGLDMHYSDLNSKLNGLQPADLIIIAARPSMGKTAFAMNIAENVAVLGGKTVAIFSLEMSAESLLRRMVCSHARVDSQRMRTGFLDRADRQRVMEAVGRLMETKLFIDDTPGISLLQMRAKSRRLKQSQGSLDLIIVDYLQLMSSDVIGSKRYENRTQEVSAISRGLKLLAKELHVPVIALSQLSRAPEVRTNDHRPQLSDLRESGSIEQDADVVCFIFRPEVYEKEEIKKEEFEGKAEIIIAKQRNGPIGTVHMVFLNKYTRFDQAQMGGDHFDSGE